MTRRAKDAETGFASRWSRLKRDARAAVPDEPAPPEPAATVAGAPAEPASDDDILRELGLPDPDTLKPGDDFSSFMAKAVPRHLRNRALRRLWVSDPVLANLDGLVDYAEDYTDAAKVTADFRTAYTIGRGWLTEPDHVADTAAGAGTEAEEATPEASATPNAGEPPAIEDEPGAQVRRESPKEESTSPATAVQPLVAPASPRRARMRFRVAEE